MSVYGPAEMTEYGNYPDRETMLQAFADTGAFNDKLQADGHFVHANGLASAITATVVDGRGEAPLVTDGPYLESKEWARMIASLSLRFGDLDVAEEAAAEAFRDRRRTVADGWRATQSRGLADHHRQPEGHRPAATGEQA